MIILMIIIIIILILVVNIIINTTYNNDKKTLHNSVGNSLSLKLHPNPVFSRDLSVTM